MALLVALEEKRSKIEEVTLNEYCTAMDRTQDAPANSDVQEVKDEIRRTHKQAREMERDIQKLENEKKILNFHK